MPVQTAEVWLLCPKGVRLLSAAPAARLTAPLGVREQESQSRSLPMAMGCVISPEVPQPRQPELSHISSKNAGGRMLARSRAHC